MDSEEVVEPLAASAAAEEDSAPSEFETLLECNNAPSLYSYPKIEYMIRSNKFLSLRPPLSEYDMRADHDLLRPLLLPRVSREEPAGLIKSKTYI